MMNEEPYMLTKELRRVICVHEAAHAVVFALAGQAVYRLAVAPEGSTEWKVERRTGGVMDDLWGVCQASDSSAYLFLRWDEGGGRYLADRKSFLALCESPDLRSTLRKRVRGEVCATLAGPISGAIFRGEEPYLCNDWPAPSDDVARAHGLSALLHWRNEFSFLAELTETTLRHPEVWRRILWIADELERKGDMEDFDALLPASIPDWPPSPRARKLPSPAAHST